MRLKSFENTESASEVQIVEVSSEELVNLKVQSNEFRPSGRMPVLAEDRSTECGRDRGMEGQIDPAKHNPGVNSGIGKDGGPKENFERGMKFHAKCTIFSKRCKEKQIYRIGIKEL